MNHKMLLNSICTKFAETSINQNDIPYIKQILNKKTTIALLKDILSQEDLLNKICDRSYTHALGFDKIVLVDLSKDIPNCKQKTQLRLHIWEPTNDSLPIVESLHEHSFDFISTILSGHLENQQFTISKLSSEETSLLEKLQKTIKEINQEDLKFLNEQVEIIEALKLKQLGSEQLDSLSMLNDLDFERIKNITNLSETEIVMLTHLEGHYVSNRVSGERKAYQHVLNKYVSLKPYNAIKLDAGDYYFHPYQLPHRLYYDNKVLNSTILITTHVPNNPEGGSLQRPTYVQHSEQHYDKISLTHEAFRSKLIKYLNYLENH